MKEVTAQPPTIFSALSCFLSNSPLCRSQRQIMPAVPESLSLVTCQPVGETLRSSAHPCALSPGRPMLVDAPLRPTPAPWAPTALLRLLPRPPQPPCLYRQWYRSARWPRRSGSSMPRAKNRAVRPTHGRRELSSASTSTTPSAGPVSASWNGSILYYL